MLIELPRNNPLQLQTWKPTRSQPQRGRARPPRPTRPPSPPPPSRASPSVRFRPDRPRQPELLRQLEERHPRSVKPRQPQPTGPGQAHPPAPHRQPPALKPYQLKPKRGQETFIEPPVEQKEVPPLNAKRSKV